jgi:hypothetical protein
MQKDIQLELGAIKQYSGSHMTRERDVRQSEVIFSKDNRKKDLDVE